MFNLNQVCIADNYYNMVWLIFLVQNNFFSKMHPDYAFKLSMQNSRKNHHKCENWTCASGIKKNYLSINQRERKCTKKKELRIA